MELELHKIVSPQLHYGLYCGFLGALLTTTFKTILTAVPGSTSVEDADGFQNCDNHRSLLLRYSTLEYDGPSTIELS